MLEHVADEQAFAAELARIIKPRGRLIVNTPTSSTPRWRRLRQAIGQTRREARARASGYTPELLAGLLSPRFTLDRHRTTRAFLRGRRYRDQLGR